MRLLNEENVEITESDIDLSVGFIREEIIIRPDAAPIDNVTKFAWADDDYEVIQRYVLYKEEEAPSPTQLDIIEAQVTYTAMMTDTLLEV